MNDGYFMNEFKPNWIIKTVSTYCKP